MSRPENTPEFFYNDLGEPRQAAVTPEVRFTDLEQVFPELAARILAQTALRNENGSKKGKPVVADDKDHIFIVRRSTDEERASNIRTELVVEVRDLYER
jgi:hypothetical protein